MPLSRLGRVTMDPLDTSKRKLKTLPCAEAGTVATGTRRQTHRSPKWKNWFACDQMAAWSSYVGFGIGRKSK